MNQSEKGKFGSKEMPEKRRKWAGNLQNQKKSFGKITWDGRTDVLTDGPIDGP